MLPKIEKAGKMKRKSLNDAENVSHIEPINLNNQFASGRRFSIRLVEKGTTLLPGCLEPPMLRGHCSATDAIQQHDVLPPQTINSACQKTDIVENSTVGVPEVIEEEDEAESSTPSLSLKLTEIVAMVRNDDDSETQSRPEDNAYQVKPEYVEILRKIINKHGDIAKDCKARTMKYRSVMLENICEVIYALDNQNVTNVKGVEQMIDQINDVKVMEVKVDWLLTRLNEILEARQAFKESSKLKEKTDSITEFIEIAKKELKESEDDKKKFSQKLKEACDREAAWKARLAGMQTESIMAYQRVKDATSKVKRFLKCSLIDGLL
ncbi:uncharacterized protein LOC131607828 [Vicia villosa]|uniref:uncharacterized protein LOC131607828 n=1 Tax=Vicia villosa TaxID=3911 RepID=UPI00273B2833|nr:uncharacterized protein LOC131607828 [Vicia villosa]